MQNVGFYCRQGSGDLGDIETVSGRSEVPTNSDTGLPAPLWAPPVWSRLGIPHRCQPHKRHGHPRSGPLLRVGSWELSLNSSLPTQLSKQSLGGCSVYYVWEPRAFMTPPKKSPSIREVTCLDTFVYKCVLFEYMFNVSIREYFSVINVFIVCIRNTAMFKLIPFLCTHVYSYMFSTVHPLRIVHCYIPRTHGTSTNNMGPGSL